MFEFKLPSLGADMDEGKLLEWHVKPGDKVKKGQVVAVVDTSKAAVDVEIWQDGTVFELLVEPGTRLPVGSVMATLLKEGESAPARKPVTLQGARKGEAHRKAPPRRSAYSGRPSLRRPVALACRLLHASARTSWGAISPASRAPAPGAW